MFAIMDAYKNGLLNIKNWWPNLIAGTIVGVVALPLAMAFAIASGVKPEQGIYTAIISAVIVAIFGGSRVQIAGPTGAFIVILAGITAKYGVTGLQIATLLAGFMLIIMGLIKLGNVIKFIPDPVIVGFTAGIGFIIFIGQWKDFFGLQLHLAIDAHFHEKILTCLHAFPNLSVPTTTLALLSLFLALVTPKITKHIPGPLVAMVIVTTLQVVFQFDGIATIGSTFGGIPQKLPTFSLPNITFKDALELIGPAFTIALLGAIESLLSATAADGMAGTRHHSNKELIGQGLANIFAPLMGGFAATGAIARTATNVRNGGNCFISALTHSVLLLLVLLYLAPYAAYIPLCTLAAILFVVAYNMSDIPHFIHIVKCAPRTDVMVLFTTFFLTIFTDLVIAVNVGVILAMLFFIRHMHETVEVTEQKTELLQHELTKFGIHSIPKNTLIYTIQGPFFFAAAEKIEHALSITSTDPKTIIFRLKEVPFMDITGLQTFKELIDDYHGRGINVYVCEANMRIRRKLNEIGMMQKLQGQHIFTTLADALRADMQINAEKITDFSKLTV